MKFILSRTDDFKRHTKKWIVGYGLLFWFISRIAAMALLMACMAIYNHAGLNPDTMTHFAGNPETAKTLGLMAYVLITVIIIAPLLEECIFRLGLSFKKLHIALGASAIPLYAMWQHLGMSATTSPIIYYIAYVAVIAAVFSLVYFLSPDRFWQRKKDQWLKPAMWLTAIAFGLLHMVAFSNYSIVLIPYMLCVVMIPFLAGCAITYYRVNLGFWWGVGLHVFNNIPAIFVLVTQ